MRKWLLIFLLLINVIVFFGFAVRGQKSTDVSNAEIEQAFELRLVSEVAPDSLVKKADLTDQEPVQERVVDGECVFYEDIENQQKADEIADFMAEQGLEPVILMGALSSAQSYSESELLASGYSTHLLAAQQVLVDVLSQADAFEVKEVFEPVGRYSIQLKGTIDRNLINKINEVLKIRYKSLKTGKKVCKGVASIKSHQ